MNQPVDSELLSTLVTGTIAETRRSSRAELGLHEGVLVFRGSVSGESSNYGFDALSVQTGSATHDLSGCDGLALRVRGDGRRYLVRVTTSESFAGAHYECEIEPAAGHWQEVALPFSGFRVVSHWRELPGHPPLEPAAVRTFGFAVYNEPGEFQLEVASLSARRERQDTPPADRAVDAEAWAVCLEAELFPLALAAAGRPLSTTAWDVFATARARRDEARIACYEDSAIVRCEDLLSVRAAQFAARGAGTRAALRVSEAIAFLVMEAAYELAIAADLVAVTPEGCSAPRDFLEREAAAEVAFSRFEALEPRVKGLLEARGLTLPGE